MGCLIAQVPPRDRPRERLERLGAAALTDAELTALVLRQGGPGISALGLAERLLAGSEGIGGLAAAELHTLASGYAMGAAKASALVAAFELGRRGAVGPASDRLVVRDAGDVAAIARRELTDVSREAAVVIVLNSANRVVKTQRLTVGTDTRCLLDARDVLRAVVSSGGTAFAVAHNHPSGDVDASPEDVACTIALKTASESIGLRFLDHLIVTPTCWRSVGCS